MTKENEVTMGVGDGSGNLFIHGSWESIESVQALMDLCESRSKSLVDERAKVLYFAHAGDGMYDMDVLEEADHHKTRHLQEADEQLRCEGKI